MPTCREPDYVAHRKEEVGEVEEHHALLRVEEPGVEVGTKGKQRMTKMQEKVEEQNEDREGVKKRRRSNQRSERTFLCPAGR